MFESGLWVKIILSLGSECPMEQKKYVIDSNHNITETPADPRRSNVTNKCKGHCSQIKGKSKTTKEGTCWYAKYHTDARKKMDWHQAIRTNSRCIRSIEESDQSSWTQSTVQREDDGAIQFWRIKFHLRNQFSEVQHWSDERWKSCLAAGGGSKRRYQYCSDNSGIILYLRALQGYSGRNLIDPMLQDNVTIQRGFFHHIYHIGCAFSSSLCHQQWIDTWRSGFKQKTNSILLAHWSKRQRKWRSWIYWLLCITSSAIRAQCMEETSRRGILGWYWPCDLKGNNILSNMIECNYPPRNTSSLLYSKSCEIEDWRSLAWKIIHISSTTTKDLITTRSRLDQREWWIGFYSWRTTASR